MKKLNKAEKIIISQISADIESGHHLIYPRSDEYYKIYTEIYFASNKNDDCLNEREKILMDYFKSCVPN